MGAVLSPRLFFGVRAGDAAGHVLCGADRLCLHPDTLPARLRPFDARWCSTGASDPQREGIVRLHHVAGWTIAAWWDRSADTRPNSNAALVAEGTHSWEVMLAAAREAFPREIARMEARYALVLSGDA